MVSRILVAVDASQRDPVALEMAAALAARQESELVALFIEDQNLIHLANLPFAAEVNRVTGAQRRLDTLQMARILGTRLAQTRRALAQITQRLSVRYSLKVTRGEYFSQAVTEATDMDVLFLVRTAGVLGRRREPMVSAGARPAQARTAREPCIVVVYDGSEGASRALILASDLSAQNGMRLVIALLGAGEDAGRLRSAVTRILGGRLGDLRLELKAVADEIELFRALGGIPCELLVVPRSFAVHFGRARKAATDLSGCSIVLVP